MKGNYQAKKTLIDMRRLEIRPCIAVCIEVFVYGYHVLFHKIGNIKFIAKSWNARSCNRG